MKNMLSFGLKLDVNIDLKQLSPEKSRFSVGVSLLISSVTFKNKNVFN